MSTFLQRPTYLTKKENSIYYSLLFVIGMYVLQLAIFFLLLLICLLVGTDEMVMNAANDYGEYEKLLRLLYGPYGFILYTVVIAPLIEEAACRLCLYPKKSYIAISIAVLTFVIPGVVWRTDYQHVLFYVKLPLSIMLGVVSYRFITNSLLRNIYEHYYPYLFYALAILFGILHLSRFEQPEWNLWPAYLMIILSLIANGIILGYTRLRLRYGFWWAILLHGLMNAKGVTGLISSL